MAKKKAIPHAMVKDRTGIGIRQIFAVSHAEFTCINGHKSVGIAKNWRSHKCPHCPKEALVFGPAVIGTLDIEKPSICKLLAGESL